MWNSLAEFEMLQEYERMFIILDTSIFRMPDNLEGILPGKRKNVLTVLTSDVYAELMILSRNTAVRKNRLFARNIDFITRSIGEDITVWNDVLLRDFYYPQRSRFVRPDCAYIYLTTSYLSAKEFVNNAIRADNVYVLGMDYLELNINNSTIIPIVNPDGVSALSALKRVNSWLSLRDSHKRGSGLRDRKDTLIANGSKGSYSLRSTKITGAEAYIYNVDGDPGQLAKVFNDKEYADNKHAKLMRMKDYELVLRDFAAMPLDILYEQDGSVLGITVKKAEGRTLEELLRNNGDRFDDALLSKILCCFIVMHAFDLIIGDVRTENIMVSDNDVIFIDTDSCQLLDYPGDGWIPEYLHKDLSTVMTGNTLREISHDVFAFLVILFKIITGNRHPLAQIYKRESENQNFFGFYHFPFNKDGKKKSAKVPVETEKLWTSIKDNKQVYDMFTDAFNFTKMVSIGEIIRNFELL